VLHEQAIEALVQSMRWVGGVLWCLVWGFARIQASSPWRYPDANWKEGFRPTADAAKFQPGHWDINSGRELLSILLPVVPNHLEFGYVRNQLRTFHSLFDLESIAAWLIVTPHEHLQSMQRFFSYELHKDLPGMRADLFQVVEDGQCASELLPDSMYKDLTLWPGWTRQQVVKLACAHLMKTPFYLVLDADVFAARRAHALDLFVTDSCDQQAHHICDTQQSISYRCKNDCYPMAGGEEDWHMRWWRNSAETLQLDVPFDWEYAIGVTPQILATDISLQLGQYIQNRFQVDSWVAYLLEVFADRNQRNWDANHELQHDPAWTEYSIYYVFAQHAQMFEQYHATSVVLQQSAVWTQEQYDMWEPCRDTFDADYGYLSLVQSNLKIPAEAVWARMQPCWHSTKKLRQ